MIKGLVSIVIPTYNGEQYIRECLESISLQNRPHEILVIDDLSTDKTVDIASEMGANVIIHDVHKGQIAGKNTGIKKMNGEYFFTVDQDDRLKPDALSILVEELQRNSAQIVMSKLEDFAETEEDEAFCHKEPFRGILTGAALFRKEVFDIIGLFDESIITGEVIDLTNPSNLPDPSEIEHMEEPMVSAEIMVTTEFVGAIMTLCQERRGEVNGTAAERRRPRAAGQVAVELGDLLRRLALPVHLHHVVFSLKCFQIISKTPGCVKRPDCKIGQCTGVRRSCVATDYAKSTVKKETMASRGAFSTVLLLLLFAF